MKRYAMFLTLLMMPALVQAEGGLEAGSAAPPFELAGSDGKSHSLDEHLGERAVVIAWFPKAFTGG